MAKIQHCHFPYAPGALLIILGFATVTGRVHTILSLPMLVLFGDASYALYLFHDPLMRSLKFVLDRGTVVIPATLNYLAAVGLFAFGLAVSVVLFK